MTHREAHGDVKEALVREGVITLQVLQEVLSEQEKSKDTLLDAVIKYGKFDETKLVRFFTSQYGCTAVNPAVFEIDRGLLDLIPKDAAEKFGALPITRYEKTLTVALMNPTNLKIIDELRAITGLRIKPAAAQFSLLKKYIDKYYNQKNALEDAASSGKAHGQELDDLVKMIETTHEEDMGAQTAELMKVAFETPVIKLVNMLLIEGIRRRASDIFIEPWEKFVRVRARVDGLLEEVIRPQKSLGPAIVSRIKIMSELNIAEHRIPQDGRFKVKLGAREVDMRVSILPVAHGEKVCLRVLDTKAQSHDISKLGFTEREQGIIKDSARHPHGMILVTGPTGSGKTTTLYSVLKYLDAPEVNITTVEDPVEYQIHGINQVNVRDQVGLTFPAALRSILRQDPDIILIGEIRDNETLDIAVKAALTGHLVLSTLHTNDSSTSVTRMANMGLEPFLIASTVLMISAQRLVRRLCPRCHVPDEAMTQESLAQLGLKLEKEPVFYKPKGCAQCRQSGYAGRTVITEILELTPAVRELIMQDASAEEIKALAHDHGMSTLREAAFHKAILGETSLEEVFRVTGEDQGLDRKQKEEKPIAMHGAGKAA